jgi:transposase
MRRPASIQPWLSPEDLQTWVREAPNREQYQKRLAIWLTHIGPFPAHQVATLLGVSQQAVWLWVGQYNGQGPAGLQRRGRGGRRWAYLSLAEEQAFLASLEERAGQGRVLTAKQIHDELCRQVGKKVSLGYLYRLFHRHGWRKLGPRPRHVKASPEKQDEFKKNSRSSSTRP